MKLKDIMKERKTTQEMLAQQLGVHQTLISQWCCGKGKPSILQVGKIADCLGVTVTDVIECFKKPSRVQGSKDSDAVINKDNLE